MKRNFEKSKFLKENMNKKKLKYFSDDETKLKMYELLLNIQKQNVILKPCFSDKGLIKQNIKKIDSIIKKIKQEIKETK